MREGRIAKMRCELFKNASARRLPSAQGPSRQDVKLPSDPPHLTRTPSNKEGILFGSRQKGKMVNWEVQLQSPTLKVTPKGQNRLGGRGVSQLQPQS